jgi:hypothetical protein
LNNVDLPTLGSPTIPHLKPMEEESYRKARIWSGLWAKGSTIVKPSTNWSSCMHAI